MQDGFDKQTDTVLLRSIIRALQNRASDLNLDAHPYGEITVKWDTKRPLQVEILHKSKEDLVTE